MNYYCILGNNCPYFILAPLALIVRGQSKFKTGQIQNNFLITVIRKSRNISSCVDIFRAKNLLKNSVYCIV